MNTTAIFFALITTILVITMYIEIMYWKSFLALIKAVFQFFNQNKSK